MTELLKPVTRRSEAIIRDGGKRRRIVVTLYPNDTIGFRPERTQREEIVTIDAAWSLAVKQRVAAERRDKIAAKKAKQKERI
jgi:hypothetical protein